MNGKRVLVPEVSGHNLGLRRKSKEGLSQWRNDVFSVRMCTYEFTCFCTIGKTGVERERKKKSFRTLKLSKLLRVLLGYKKPDNVRKTGVCWESHRIDLF